jgi:hypothetical protein
MIFLFPVPLWFVVVWCLGSLAFVIYEVIEDTELRSVRRYPEQSPGALDELARRIDHHLNAYKIAEAERLLKRLAETRT